MSAVKEIESASESGDKAQVRSVNRAFDVLSCFTPAQPLATLSEIARSTGLATSTTARMLATLETARLVCRYPDGRYGMGSRLIQFGLTALSTSLYQVAERHLQALAQATGETANLGVPTENGEVMYLRQVESRHAIRHANWVGRTVPIKGTAIGTAVRGEVNSDGFYATRATLEPDVTAIAAPVHGALGQIVGALSLTGPTFRISDAQIVEYGKRLVEEARQMSTVLRGQ
jgi:DNA-binding IclR family transcriptional regulator